MNLAEHPVDVAAGSVIGCYTGIQDADIGRPWRESDPKEMQRPQVGLSKVEVPLHMKELYKQATSHCKTEHDRQQVATLLCKYSDVFSQGEEDVGRTELVQHEVLTVPNTQPIRQAPYRVGPEKEAEIDRQVSKLARQGMIEPTYGAWSSPVVLVRKKDQTWRLCVDYRKLNAVTKQDAYPLPRIDDSLDALSGSKLFSTLDMMSGYWQVPLSPEAQEKAAFITRNGLWRWKVLPFGLTSAPATFQRLMERVLQGLHWKTLLLYLDDIIVMSTDFQSHLSRLTEVFERLRQAGLKLKPSKCHLMQAQVKYLGHVVSSAGVATDPEKVEVVNRWPRPTDETQLRAFLGTTGYYHRYVPNYASVAKPSTLLTGEGSTWIWGHQNRVPLTNSSGY